MTPNDWMLLAMQLVSALVRMGIILPLLFWTVGRIDAISDTDIENWWGKADDKAKAVYLSVRLAVVALLLASVLA